MYARKLTPQEIWRSELNMAVAFESSFDLEKAKEKAKTAEADPNKDHWGAFTEDSSPPVASFVMNLYEARFDGHIVKMGGVGGVASLPAHRRGGAIRACMEASFRDLYDRGFVFSALYPFSHVFYRKFGFENGQICWFWQVPLQNLPQKDVGGRVYQLFPGDDLSPLLDVYEQMYGNVNLSVIRKKYDESLEKNNLLEQKRYIFVWEDETGRPGSFLIGGRDGEVLNCRTNFDAPNGLLFRDARSLTGLLSFVRTAFMANFQKLRFTVPSYIDISSIIPEPSAEGRGFFFNGMLRTVNAEQALRLCKCRGEGRVTIEVSDPLLKENNGIFRLTFAPGGENQVERVSEEPDVSLGVGELGQLLCGVKTVDDLAWMPGAALHDPSAPLEKVFYRKPCHILNLF